MDYFEDCVCCGGQMKVHESPGADGTVITEECSACGHLDAYVVTTENECDT